MDRRTCESTISDLDKKDRNRKIQAKKRTLKSTGIMLDCAMHQIERLSNMEDPVLRYTLPMEIQRMAIDVAISLMKLFFEEETERLIEEIETSSEEGEDRIESLDTLRVETAKVTEKMGALQEIMERFYDRFASWIATPCYNPDYPLGRCLMETSQHSFTHLSEEENKK